MTESAGATSTLLPLSASDWLRLVSHILSTEYNIKYPGDNQIIKLAPLTEGRPTIWATCESLVIPSQHSRAFRTSDICLSVHGLVSLLHFARRI
jgi:hypothetical protein